MEKEMRVISSSCFSRHSFIYYKNGDLKVMGFNKYGQLGLGHNNDNVETETLLLNNNNIIHICLGVYHSFYLQDNGDLYGCGFNKYGQLGLGNKDDQYKFVLVMKNVDKVACGSYFTIIQKRDGTVHGFGQNNRGQLGTGTKSSAILEPVQLWKEFEDIVSFCCGEEHVLFLRSNGELFVIGRNDSGQLGIGEKKKSDQSKPQLLLTNINIKSMACGRYHSFIYTKNEVFGFGKNEWGQLGKIRKINYFLPELILNENDLLKVECGGSGQENGTKNEIQSIHCGAFHSFILLKNKKVLCSGYNIYGQLANGNIVDQSEFQKILDDVLFISTGYNHTLFVKKEEDKESIFVSGFNDCGQLGLGNKTNQVKPHLLNHNPVKFLHNGANVIIPPTHK